MKADFSPAYANYLGYNDGRELGTKHPQRDFQPNGDERHQAYFNGLKQGVQESWTHGLDMCCVVRWDNPGFDTPACGGKATHIGVWNGHVVSLCKRHAAQATNLHEPGAMPHWSVIPISWLGGDDAIFDR